MVIRALKDQGVTHIFGYPGGAVLPIYDALFEAEGITHVLVRHEQGAVHAAEGYARSTGKPGVVLVTSGPGATNAVTGLTDALMDSIPLVVLTGQVPTHLIGTDAFQECDTVGITRPCTKHNWLVKDVERSGRASCTKPSRSPPPAGPARWWSTFPRTCSSRTAPMSGPKSVHHRTYQPKTDPDLARHRAGGGDDGGGQAAGVLYRRRHHQFRAAKPRKLLRELVDLTGFPVTSTLMGLGAFPGVASRMAGHAGHARHLGSQPCDA